MQQDFSTGFHIFMADCPEMSKLKTSSSKIIYMWDYLGFPNTAKTINILSNPQTHNRSMFARVQFVIPHLEIVVLRCDFFHFCICICGLLPRNRRPSELFASMGLEKKQVKVCRFHVKCLVNMWHFQPIIPTLCINKKETNQEQMRPAGAVSILFKPHKKDCFVRQTQQHCQPSAVRVGFFLVMWF